MTKRKAIIFDIDGTAVDSPSQELPSRRLAEAIRQVEANYYVSAATGRSWLWAKATFEHLELEDPCIVAAGTQVCDPKTGETLWRCDMDTTDVARVMEILRNIPNCRLLYNDYTGNDYFAGGQSPDDVDFTEAVHFINCIFVPADEAAQLIEKLSVVEGLAVVQAVSQRPGYKDILITNRLATKEQAIAELLRLVKVERSEAIGVGDGHNDIEMFRAVGHKVAMGNAMTELKDAADVVIGEVAADGLAKFLEELKNN